MIVRVRPPATNLDTLRADLAAALELLSPTDRIATMRQAVIEYGGTAIPLRDNTDGGLFYPSVSVLGVTGDGMTEVEAIAEWIKAVTRMAVESETEVAA